jgi:hypothetical protein
MFYNLFNMRKYILNKKSLLIVLAILLFFSLFYSFFFKSTEAQVCLPLSGYLVWPGTWESGWIPMASTTQYVLTRSPIYVSGSNIGIGTLSPVYKFQVNGDISGIRLCIGSDCRDQWPSGTLSGTGSAGQVTFWTGPGDLGGDNNLFWDNTNKRLGIGTTTPQTSLHVIGNITANTFLGTINAANVSSGQFGANTGGGNYYFMGNVGIGTTTPSQKLTVAGKIDVTGNRIVNLASPIDSNDAATKGYVDAQSGGYGNLVFKRVFVTSVSYNGNLGGLSGADAKCQARADAAGLGGTWKAIISNSYESAVNRIGYNWDCLITVTGRLIDCHTYKIGGNVYSIWDGSLAWGPIATDEYGNDKLGYVWTGSLINGAGTASTTYTCLDWTTNASNRYGIVGASYYSENGWISHPVGNIGCNNLAALYCIEQ